MSEINRKKLYRMISCCAGIADIISTLPDHQKQNNYFINQNFINQIGFGIDSAAICLRQGIAELMNVLNSHQTLYRELEIERQENKLIRNMIQELTGYRDFDELSEDIQKPILKMIEDSGAKKELRRMLDDLGE